jgi:Na+/phosphate symporter
MERVTTEFVPDVVTATPAARGAALGLVLLVVERFLVYFDTALFGVLFLILGVVLAIEGRDWWPQAGRTMAALGLVFLGSRLVGDFVPFYLI